MTNKSESLSNTSKSKFEQLPLKGFTMEVQSEKPGWRKTILGMGDGRFKVAYTKIVK